MPIGPCERSIVYTDIDKILGSYEAIEVLAITSQSARAPLFFL